jgi:ketosteroid isomerase-like protein
MNDRRRWETGLILACMSLPSAALELVSLSLEDPSGPTMSGQIPLQQPAGAGAVVAWLVSPEGYRAAGLAFHSSLSSVQISFQTQPDDGRHVRLDGLPASGAPYDVLLMASDSSGSRTGRYRVDPARLPTVGPRDVAMVRLGRQPAAQTIEPALAAVEAWRDAWSRRDLGAYLSAYAPDYAGRSPDSTRAQWVNERTARIRDRRQIDVQISDLQLAERGDAVLASFNQTYRSGVISSHTRKQLVLRDAGGRWLIVQESEVR